MAAVPRKIGKWKQTDAELSADIKKLYVCIACVFLIEMLVLAFQRFSGLGNSATVYLGILLMFPIITRVYWETNNG